MCFSETMPRPTNVGLVEACAAKQRQPEQPDSAQAPPSPASFAVVDALPREAFVVKNTFVELVEAPAAKRRASCPARPRRERTAVMLSNLPNRAKEVAVKQHFAKLNIRVHEFMLPIDKRTGVNRGYAFCKFEREEDARDFISAVQGTQLERSQSKKVLAATFAVGGTNSKVRAKVPA